MTIKNQNHEPAYEHEHKHEHFHFLIINGPNINLLGLREPDLYGEENYDDLANLVYDAADKNNWHIDFYQSNHEGDIVDKLQEAYYAQYDGIVINAAAYTHTSIAIGDTLKAISLPAIEVHITDPDLREPYRHVNYIREACIHTISGQGIEGYVLALEALEDYLTKGKY